MIWLAVKLALGKALRTFLDIARAYPWQCALAASLCLSGWLYMGRQSARDELAAFKVAQAVATAKAIAARKAEEARHVERADRKDRETEVLKADYRARTDRHIERMRCPSNQASGAVAAAPDQGAGSADAAGGTTLVAVIADDLRICSDNTARLEKAREWALGLNSE